MHPSKLRLLRYTSAALVILLSGCSSMSKNECLTVDWRTVGYEDGVDGYSGDRIGQHRKACAKYGVSTDLSLYQQGREEGLREYCQPANGYRLGSHGGSYGGVCPSALQPAFVAAYANGHQLYVLESSVNNVNAQIAYRRRELDRLEHGMIMNAADVASNDTTSRDRVDALVDTAQMAEQMGRIKGEIRQLEDDRVRYQNDLDNFRANQPPIT